MANSSKTSRIAKDTNRDSETRECLGPYLISRSWPPTCLLGLMLIVLAGLHLLWQGLVFYRHCIPSWLHLDSLFQGLSAWIPVAGIPPNGEPFFGLATLLAGSMLLALTLGCTSDKIRRIVVGIDGSNRLLIAGGLLGVAFLIRISSKIAFPDMSYLNSMVDGLPFSDAYNWFELGGSVAEGKGLIGSWSARRPFFAIVLAGVFIWTGPSVVAAQVVNILTGSAAVVLVYLICERTFNRLIAIPVALFIAFDVTQIGYSLVTLSETVGFFFNVLALFLLILGLDSNRITLVLAGGLCFGLENLTRTMSLAGGPGLMLCMVYIMKSRGQDLRRIVLALAVFVLGVGVAMGPWLVRQKMTHGIAAISDNTASGLYAASSAKFRQWTGRVDLEADERGISPGLKDRYEYFNREALKNIRENPTFYINNVETSFRGYLKNLTINPLETCYFPIVLLFLALAFIHGSYLGAGNSLMIVASLVSVCLAQTAFSPLMGRLVLPLSMLAPLVILKDKLFIILINNLVFIGLGAALFALATSSRLVLATSWIPLAFLFCLWLAIAKLVSTRYHCADPDYFNGIVERPLGSCQTGRDFSVGTKWSRMLKTAGLLLAGLAVLTGFRLVYLNFITSPAPPRAPVTFSPGEKARILDSLRKAFPSLVGPDEEFSQVISDVHRRQLNQGRLGLICGEARTGFYHLKAGEESCAWSRPLMRRNYDRSMTYLPACPVIFPGRIAFPGHRCRICVAGRFSVDPSRAYDWLIVEGMAIMPVGPNGHVHVDGAVLATNKEHLKIIQRLNMEKVSSNAQ